MNGTEEATIAHLRIADRCDRCNAVAYVRTGKDGLLLDFCAHHFEKNWAELMSHGFEVIEDIRSTLQSRPGDDGRVAPSVA